MRRDVDGRARDVLPGVLEWMGEDEDGSGDSSGARVSLIFTG